MRRKDITARATMSLFFSPPRIPFTQIAKRTYKPLDFSENHKALIFKQLTDILQLFARFFTLLLQLFASISA